MSQLLEYATTPTVFIVMSVATVLTYHVGKAVATEPTEETMFERLVALRKARKIEVNVREELNKQLERASTP
jgi:hypothetical protein